jgi:hypothetical protein
MIIFGDHLRSAPREQRIRSAVFDLSRPKSGFCQLRIHLQMRSTVCSNLLEGGLELLFSDLFTTMLRFNFILTQIDAVVGGLRC